MRTYGIFDGVGRHDELIAVAVPTYETWMEIHGPGKVDDYLDFLLEQEDALYEGPFPARIVRVPLDLGHYRAWLSKNSYWQDGPEARAAWALYVARNPRELSAVLKMNPVIPRAPENREEVYVYYVVLVFQFNSMEEAVKLSVKLEHPAAEEIARTIEKALPEGTKYRKVSPLRAYGARVVVGDRLVQSPSLEEVEEYLQETVPETHGERAISIPREFKITKNYMEKEMEVEFPAYMVAYLPVALHGDRELLDYWDDYILNEFHIVPGLSEAVNSALKKMGLSPFGPTPLIPRHKTEFYLNWLFRQDNGPDAQDENGEGRDREGKKPAKRNGNLKRIK